MRNKGHMSINRLALVFLLALALLVNVVIFGEVQQGTAQPALQQKATPAPLPAVPEGFEPMEIPAVNPMTAEKVALGKQLFFDQRLSGDGSRSCYSCHVCEHGLTDGLPVSIGAFGKKLTRNSPPLWNIGYHKQFYWDGRSPSLEKQAMAAWTGTNMGAKADEIAKTLDGIPGYREQFEKVFGGPVTADAIVKALSAFERTLICGDTAFDRFERGNKKALSKEAQRGWDLFRGKAGCGTCHAGYLFTDLEFHNVGVGMDAAEPDTGRLRATKEEKDTGAFKTPTLRGIGQSAPYFHDGRAATLEQAVDAMLAGGKANKYLDTKNLKKVDLTAKELKDLLAFLRSLDCPCDLKPPKLPGMQ